MGFIWDLCRNCHFFEYLAQIKKRNVKFINISHMGAEEFWILKKHCEVKDLIDNVNHLIYL